MATCLVKPVDSVFDIRAFKRHSMCSSDPRECLAPYGRTKAGTRVKSTVKVEIIAENPKYVCRGGLKLEKALKEFDIDVTDVVALDSGLSTGGFTDCLLQGGATRVYGRGSRVSMIEPRLVASVVSRVQGISLSLSRVCMHVRREKRAA